MPKTIYGINIPECLENDYERARAYAAGWLFLRCKNKADRLPEELREIGFTYGADTTRSNCYYPEISKVESSFWSGYITSSAARRDKNRSGSHEYPERDLLQELGRPTRSLRRELDELFHTDLD